MDPRSAAGSGGIAGTIWGKPCVVGAAYLGESYGPNAAERHALIVGLEAVHPDLEMRLNSVTEVVAYADNQLHRARDQREIGRDRLSLWYERDAGDHRRHRGVQGGALPAATPRCRRRSSIAC